MGMGDICLPQKTYGIIGKTSGHYRDGLNHMAALPSGHKLTVLGSRKAVKPGFRVPARTAA